MTSDFLLLRTELEIGMATDKQRVQATRLRELHQEGTLILANAWDAGSAAMIAGAGADAIATTSAGVSWALGRPDGQHLTRDEMTEVIARIVAAVDVPVSADIEGGYGPDPADVATTVEAVVRAGAVGINLEDSLAPGGPLFDSQAQAARIVAARQAAVDAGLPDLLINARTDVFLFGIGDPTDRFDDVLARASAVADAGADCLFVPGLTDIDTLSSLVAKTTLPINVMVGPGSPSIAELRAIGVRRVSVGQAVAQAAYSLARRATAELLATGTYDAITRAEPFSAINGTFTPR